MVAAHEWGTARRLTDPLLVAGAAGLVAQGRCRRFSVLQGRHVSHLGDEARRVGCPAADEGHGDDRDPRFSPDGTRIAFSSDRAFKGNYDIWVVEVAGGKLTQWTSDPADEFEPAWRWTARRSHL